MVEIPIPKWVREKKPHSQSEEEEEEERASKSRKINYIHIKYRNRIKRKNVKEST